MNIKIILLLVLSFVFSVVLFVNFFVDKNTIKVTPTKQIEYTENSNKEENAPQTKSFSIKPLDKPLFANRMSTKDVTFSVEIKNLSVSPFITNVGLNNCQIQDSLGNVYNASTYGNEIQLEKALPMGESTTITFKNVGLDPELVGESEVGCRPKNHKKLEKCIYSAQGDCDCTPLGNVILTQCEVAISNNSTQASNGWGTNEQNLIFNN